MHSVYDVIDHMLLTNEDCVLATVIHVQGSAYRKEGTSMLFLDNGQQIGTISAGCLETDLSIRAKKLLHKKSESSYSITYDMRAEDDLSWGRGAGCNGVIRILLERVTSSLRKTYTHVQKHLEKQTSVKLVKYMYNDETTIHTTCVPFHEDSSELPHAAIENNQRHLYIEANNPDDPSVFVQTFTPKRRLFIFGAGPDVIPLATMAYQVDFSVHVWDWRAAYLKRENFPQSKLYTDPHVENFIDDMSFTTHDSIIIMTHDFQKDQEILSYLKHLKTYVYVGVLGPRRRTKRLLQHDTIPPYIHSPVGKNIGAEGPAEIAVSIISDLIDAYRSAHHTRSLQTKVNRTSNM